MWTKKLQTRLYLIHEILRRQIFNPCPVCALAAYGGDFCKDCQDDISLGMQGIPRCFICADELMGDAFKMIASPCQLLCQHCRADRPMFERTVVAMRYAFPVDVLMHGLKERGQLHLAGTMGRMLYQAVLGNKLPLPALDLIVPIPASQSAIRQRGFNPAGEIARTVAWAMRVPCRRGLLHRQGDCGAQKALNRDDRQIAVQDLYVCEQRVPNVWVGVVDDVMTTGATMRQAALALRRAGAAGVVALAAMRTPPVVWHNTNHV